MTKTLPGGLLGSVVPLVVVVGSGGSVVVVLGPLLLLENVE